MFDQLSDRLQGTLSDLRSRGKLSEADVDKAMREIRLALLEADVNFKVTKGFVAGVREKAIGAGVLESLDPGQMVVKVVNEQLAELMGGSGRELVFASQGPDRDPDGRPPGLGQDDRDREARPAPGERRAARSVAVAACDTQRPAAVEQLERLAEQAGATFYSQGTERSPVDIAEWALGQARSEEHRRPDRRHRRPPPHRRGADGPARPDQAADASRTTSCSSSTR